MSHTDPDPQGQWATALDNFVEDHDCDKDVLSFLERFRVTGPLGVNEGLNPLLAAVTKPDLCDFYLHGVALAIDDHQISDLEIREFAHLRRLLRLEDRDLVEHAPSVVGSLFTNMLGKMLEDGHINPAEALGKVELQAILGLSYDESLKFAAPHVEAAMLRILRQVDQRAGPENILDEIKHYRGILTQLDTAYDLNSDGRNQSSGYVYLLMNPVMPGVLKVGMTTRKSDARIAELSSATGVPVPFQLLFEVSVQDAYAAEFMVHEYLEGLGTRVDDNREFFRVEPHVAVQAILQARDAVGGLGPADQA